MVTGKQSILVCLTSDQKKDYKNDIIYHWFCSLVFLVYFEQILLMFLTSRQIFAQSYKVNTLDYLRNECEIEKWKWGQYEIKLSTLIFVMFQDQLQNVKEAMLHAFNEELRMLKDSVQYLQNENNLLKDENRKLRERLKIDGKSSDIGWDDISYTEVAKTGPCLKIIFLWLTGKLKHCHVGVNN